MVKSIRLGLSTLERAHLTDVRVSPLVRDELYSKFDESAEEICGSLFGELTNSTLALTELQMFPNVAQSEREFAISVDEMVLAIGHHSQRLVGIFHSHPRAEPAPSILDLQFLTVTPFVWAIIGKIESLAPSMRFFVYADAHVKEIGSNE